MAKYHLTDDGPKRCVAKSDETCRAKFDGDKTVHFDNTADAEEAFEKSLAKTSLTVPATKRPEPQTLSPTEESIRVWNDFMREQKYAAKHDDEYSDDVKFYGELLTRFREGSGGTHDGAWVRPNEDGSLPIAAGEYTLVSFDGWATNDLQFDRVI